MNTDTNGSIKSDGGLTLILRMDCAVDVEVTVGIYQVKLQLFSFAEKFAMECAIDLCLLID